MEWDAEMLAESRKLEIARWWLVWVLLKVPHGPLQGAKNLVAGWEVHVKPFVPGPQKLRIELSIVSNELGKVVRLAVRAKLRDAGVTAEELCETLGGIFGLKGFLGPDTAVVMVLS
jgi:hypothetical protein